MIIILLWQLQLYSVLYLSVIDSINGGLCMKTNGDGYLLVVVVGKIVATCRHTHDYLLPTSMCPGPTQLLALECSI